MDMDTGRPASGESQGTALVINDNAVVVGAICSAEGDIQETPLVIDEDSMLLEVQITILIEEIVVVNNVTQQIECPMLLTIPTNAGDKNHIQLPLSVGYRLRHILAFMKMSCLQTGIALNPMISICRHNSSKFLQNCIWLHLPGHQPCCGVVPH
jgi:hypothetical protein